MNTSVYLLFLAFVVIASGYEFTANLSAKAIKDNDWSYKNIVASRFDLPGIWIGGSFISGKFTGDLRAGAIDLSVSSAYCFPGIYPTAYLAYFKSNYNVSIFGQAFATADMSAAAGYIGTSFLFLEERDPSGKVVTVSSLKWVPNILTDNGLTYTLSEASQVQDELQYVTFTGKSNNEDTPKYQVEVSYLASEIAGIVGGEDGVKDVPVVPGSLESIVKINNYPYKSTDNHLSLVLGVATGSVDVSASGRTISDPKSEVYFSVSKNGYVSGNKVSLNVSSYASGQFTDIDNDDLQGQVSGKYGAQAKVMLLRVAFPAGSSSIVYDPSLGVGASVEENYGNAALFVSPLLSLLLLAIAFALF